MQKYKTAFKMGNFENFMKNYAKFGFFMSILIRIDTLHVLSTQKPKFKNAQKRATKRQKSDSKNNKKMIVQNHIEYCEHLKLS